MSNFKLWEIPEAIELIGEMMMDPETGEMLSEEETKKLISDLGVEKDKKTEYLCKMFKNLMAEVEVLKVQEKEFSRRRKVAENKAERLQSYIGFALNGEKWKAEDASISVSFRNTKNAVNIVALDDIPSDFFKTPHTESNLSKTMIKEAILNGESVPGAILEDRVSVIIK